MIATALGKAIFGGTKLCWTLEMAGPIGIQIRRDTMFGTVLPVLPDLTFVATFNAIFKTQGAPVRIDAAGLIQTTTAA